MRRIVSIQRNEELHGGDAARNMEFIDIESRLTFFGVKSPIRASYDGTSTNRPASPRAGESLCAHEPARE